MITSEKKVLIIDDDASNNMLSKMSIKLMPVDSRIKNFLIPEEALAFYTI